MIAKYMAKSFRGYVFSYILFGLSAISPVQYVVMMCECVHCRMKFAVAIVCLLMLNILVNVSGNCLLSYTLFTGSVSSVQFSSVTEFVSRSIIIQIMTAALTHSS